MSSAEDDRVPRGPEPTGSDPERPDEPLLTKSVRYGLPAARLFALLVTEDQLRDWTGAEVELDPVPGGELVVRLPGWPELTGSVLEVREPDRLVTRCVAADWAAPLTSVIELRNDGPTGCRLTLTETGFGTDGELLRTRDWLWSHWLVRLAAMPA